VRRSEEMSDGETVHLSLLLVLLVVFLLPRMHERYFYLATPLSIALACRRGGRLIPAAVLIEAATLSAYWELAPLPLASLMMLAAIVLALMGAKSVCGRKENML